MRQIAERFIGEGINPLDRLAGAEGDELGGPAAAHVLGKGVELAKGEAGQVRGRGGAVEVSDRDGLAVDERFGRSRHDEGGCPVARCVYSNPKISTPSPSLAVLKYRS